MSLAHMSLAQDFDFTGRRVLVTGAANGFGAAMAALYAAHGATLVLADREAAPLQTLADQLKAEAIVFDQGEIASIDALAAQAGEVDVLVNNAGILVAKPLLETDIEDAIRLVQVDFIGVMRLTQQIGRGMVARQRGVVLSISSQTAFCGAEGRGVYSAAKAAVSQLSRALAVEWGPHVRVLCLAPGRSITRMTVETARADYQGDRGLSRVPLGRWGTAEEIAKMALMLTSNAASYVTGETVIADGGYVLG